MKRLSLCVALILAILPMAPSWGKGYFQARVSAVHVDQNGFISFTTTTDMPGNVSNGCLGALNIFHLQGGAKNSASITLVGLLEKALQSNASVGIWTDGCHSGFNNVLYLGLLKKDV